MCECLETSVRYFHITVMWKWYTSDMNKTWVNVRKSHVLYLHITVMWKVRNAKNRLHCIEREICCRQSLRHSTASVHIPVNMFRNVSVNAVVTPSAASTLHVGVTPYSLYESVFVTYLNKITFLYCAQNIISSASP